MANSPQDLLVLSPSLIIHCDWGSAPSKRWMATAALGANGQYTASAPEPVGELDSLLSKLRGRASEPKSILVGFDFPIGLPWRYAESAEIPSFLPFLAGLQADSGFWDICQTHEDISTLRPFYPFNFMPKGSRKRQHLLDGLGCDRFEDLLRICERPQAGMSAAGSLFWTLGAKAPGRGAIEAWRHVLAPALRERTVRIWPFHGSLRNLFRFGATVIAETYPTQYHHMIFDGPLVGKGNLAVRQTAATKLLSWAAENGVTLTTPLQEAVIDGFTLGRDDAFDAVIGLFGMIEAIRNRAEEPSDPIIRNIEGWILGQPLRKVPLSS